MENTVLTRLSHSQVRSFYDAGHWRDDTIYGLVRDHAEAVADKVAVREGSRWMTYAELVMTADRLVATLQHAGVRVGQRVAVWLPSRLETAVTVVACSRAGFVICPSLHRSHTVGEVVDLLERMRAAALIGETGYGADGDRADVFERARRLSTMHVVRSLDPLTSGVTEPAFGDLDTGWQPGEKRTDPDTVVYLAFTSGTTGRPKGVLHSDNTLLANARALARDWSIDADAIVYSFSPVSHNLGFGAMVMTLAVGGEFVIHDVPRGESLVHRLSEVGATFVFGVPTHALDLLSELRAHPDVSLERVRGFRISGAAGSAAIVEGLLEHGVVPQSGYGMTEAGSHHYTLPDDDPTTIAQTSGRACSGYDVAIFDRDDRDRRLAVGEVGEIGGRGASLMLGYFDDQAATEDAFNADGWFMTGDLGWMDEAGCLRITGRTKEVIIRGGHNIFPARIEDLALRHEAVRRAAALPIADQRLGERVCLVIATEPGSEVTGEELLRHLAASGLSHYDMPEYLAVVEDFPLTPSGKVLKRSLAEDIAERRIEPLAVRSVAGSATGLANGEA